MEIITIRAVQRRSKQNCGLNPSNGPTLAARPILAPDPAVIRELVERNRQLKLPVVHGSLDKDYSPGGLFGFGKVAAHSRWFELDPANATFSWRCTQDGAIRHQLSLYRLESLNVNVPQKRFFMKFEGRDAGLCLQATSSDDFTRWMDVLSRYIVEPTPEAEPCPYARVPLVVTGHVADFDCDLHDAADAKLSRAISGLPTSARGLPQTSRASWKNLQNVATPHGGSVSFSSDFNEACRIIDSRAANEALEQSHAQQSLISRV